MNVLTAQTPPESSTCTASPVRVRRVLLVEDDKDIGALLHTHLQDCHAEVALASDGKRGLERGLAEPWDLVILDLGLPGMDGLHVASTLRRGLPTLPILIVTARSSEEERVLGLNTGADDYIVKPFSIQELVARVRAVFRRSDALRMASRSKISAFGDLVLDDDRHRVTVAGCAKALTVLEFRLLDEFIRHPGKAFSRAELLERVWGSRYQGYRHTVNTHINRLRAKIEVDPGNPRYIQTVWGVGYRLGDQ